MDEPKIDGDSLLRGGFCAIWLAALVLGVVFSTGALTGDSTALRKMWGCVAIYAVAVIVHIKLMKKKLKENDEQPR